MRHLRSTGRLPKAVRVEQYLNEHRGEWLLAGTIGRCINSMGRETAYILMDIEGVESKVDGSNFRWYRLPEVAE